MYAPLATQRSDDVPGDPVHIDPSSLCPRWAWICREKCWKCLVGELVGDELGRGEVVDADLALLQRGREHPDVHNHELQTEASTLGQEEMSLHATIAYLVQPLTTNRKHT